MNELNIQWADAPEGYDIWIVDDNGSQPSAWHRESGDRYQDQLGLYWSKGGDGFTAYHRPVWSGHGLPPVGSKVLFVPDTCDNADVDWHRRLSTDGSEVVEILAHYSPCKDSGTVAVFCFDSKDNGREVEQAVAGCFKPLPPAASEEELDEIERLYEEGGPAALWDAGYRKAP